MFDRLGNDVRRRSLAIGLDLDGHGARYAIDVNDPTMVTFASVRTNGLPRLRLFHCHECV